MALKPLIRTAIRLRHAVRGVRRDIAGVAALEFAFIAPLMLLMLVGTAEIARMISMDRRFNQITSMTGDLLAREQVVNAAAFNGMMDSIEHVFKPWDPASLKMNIIHVIDPGAGNGTPFIAETQQYGGGSPPARCGNYTLPPDLLPASGGSVIIVESEYNYAPFLFNFVLPFASFSASNAATWTDKSFHIPRRSLCVDMGNNCTCP